MTSKIILFSVLLAISVDGFARTGTSIWLEPLLSKRFKGTITFLDRKEKRNGIMYGGRLGVRKLIPGAVVGIDLRKGGFELESERGDISEIDANHLGFFMSFTKKGFPFKVWISYFFKYNDKYVESNEILKGKSINIGVGFALLSFLNINLEFSRFTLNELEYPDGRTVSITSLSNGVHEYAGTEFLLGISIPMDISSVFNALF